MEVPPGPPMRARSAIPSRHSEKYIIPEELTTAKRYINSLVSRHQAKLHHYSTSEPTAALEAAFHGPAAQSKARAPRPADPTGPVGSLRQRFQPAAPEIPAEERNYDGCLAGMAFLDMIGLTSPGQQGVGFWETMFRKSTWTKKWVAGQGYTDEDEISSTFSSVSEWTAGTNVTGEELERLIASVHEQRGLPGQETGIAPSDPGSVGQLPAYPPPEPSTDENARAALVVHGGTARTLLCRAAPARAGRTGPLASVLRGRWLRCAH